MAVTVDELIDAFKETLYDNWIKSRHITTLEQNVAAMAATIEELKDRVTALEEPKTGGTGETEQPDAAKEPPDPL
jgi:hypothetical protein